MDLFTKDLIGDSVFPFKIDVFDFSPNADRIVKQVALAFDRLVKDNGGYITYRIYKKYYIFLKRWSGFPITLESILDMIEEPAIDPIEKYQHIEFCMGNRSFYAKFDLHSGKFYKLPLRSNPGSYIRVEA